MPVQLRKRLTCHYCGKRSNSRQNKGYRFKCEHCLAVNFLDENGEIADVPPEEFESPKQYAQRRSPPNGDDNLLHNSSIFCEICLKNQHFYNLALSDFLPDPDAENYAECEAALPGYLKELEQRYPQCCAQCEPKVRAQLQQATYNARSDHVRRMLERSRARRIASRWGWRNMVVNGAAVGYFASLGVQVLWHALGTRVNRLHPDEYLNLQSCMTLESIPAKCVTVPQQLMVWSLILGLVCSWWNPKWQHRLQSREGRLVGLGRFYTAQFSLLIIRFIAWVVLVDLPVPPRFEPSLHSVFLVLIIMISSRALFGTIKIETAGLVNWHEDPAPLLSPNQFIPPQPSQAFGHQTTQEVPVQNQQFALTDLAPQQRAIPRSWQPPIPPSEDIDSMDWTPSQTSFQPNPRQPRFRPGGPNPFHGTLPALPAKGIGRSHIQPAEEPKQAIGLPPGFFDKPQHRSTLPGTQENNEAVIAQPKFFPHNADPGTGLENIFEKVFSLQDFSHDARTRLSNQNGSTPLSPSSSNHNQNHTNQSKWTPSNYLAALSFVALLATLPTWSIMSKYFNSFHILSFGAAIPTLHLLLSLPSSSQPSSTILFAAEALLLTSLAFYRYRSPENIIDPFWDKIGSGVLSLLVPQEFYLIHSQPQLLPEPVQNTQQPTIPHQPPTELASSYTPEQTRSSDLRRSSIDSTATTDSMTTTTSTMSAWKTPKPESSRRFMDVGSTERRNPFDMNMGSLALQDDYPGYGNTAGKARSRGRYGR